MAADVGWRLVALHFDFFSAVVVEGLLGVVSCGFSVNRVM